MIDVVEVALPEAVRMPTLPAPVASSFSRSLEWFVQSSLFEAVDGCVSYLDRLVSAQVSFDEYGTPALLVSEGQNVLYGFGWGSVHCVGCSGFRVESFQSV